MLIRYFSIRFRAPWPPRPPDSSAPAFSFPHPQAVFDPIPFYPSKMNILFSTKRKPAIKLVPKAHDCSSKGEQAGKSMIAIMFYINYLIIWHTVSNFRLHFGFKPDIDIT